MSGGISLFINAVDFFERRYVPRDIDIDDDEPLFDRPFDVLFADVGLNDLTQISLILVDIFSLPQ